MVIDEFSGEYRWLSNFYPSRVEFGGLVFGSVEAAFQSAKTLTGQRDFVGLRPGQAKRLGRSVALRPGWEGLKVGVMKELLVVKFEHVELGEMLARTKPCELIEGNRWGDHFWGVCNGVGENHLGKLLMEVRDDG